MPSAIELFSGCGGLSTGLIAAGFEVLSAVEINQTAADTYGLNHPTVNLIVDDVRNVTAVSLLRRHNLRIGELDLLAGCSPCQGFSRLRKGESGSTDRSHAIWRRSIMESSQYFIAKSDKYVLVRKIGNRFFRIISDTNITPVELIYQKICSEGYTSEQELFQDIFDLYGNISIFSFNKGNDSTLPK